MTDAGKASAVLSMQWTTWMIVVRGSQISSGLQWVKISLTKKEGKHLAEGKISGQENSDCDLAMN